MDPIANPYAPGAGAPPPELAGRDALIEQVRIATARIRAGRQAKSVLLVGLRGVGKTVLLDRMRRESVSKSLIFMPMAISFVGAGIIWGLVYEYRDPSKQQVGLLRDKTQSHNNSQMVRLILARTVDERIVINHRLAWACG